MLCASHITSEQRYLLLLHTIENILNQTLSIDFYVSFYCSKDFVFPKHPRLHMYRQKEPLSQFEHFYFLSSLIDDPDHTFCLFCDDDDFSHPQRVEFYVSCEDNGQDIIHVNHGLLLMNERSDITIVKHTMEKCEEMRKMGRAVIVNGYEYFMYCVRASCLLSFCKIMKHLGYLHLNICDILFGSVLFYSKKSKIQKRPNMWLYAYSSVPKERESEYQRYHRLVRDLVLRDVLKKQFNIPDTWKGETNLYGDEDTEEYI
jgi:hypothetical protein